MRLCAVQLDRCYFPENITSTYYAHLYIYIYNYVCMFSETKLAKFAEIMLYYHVHVYHAITIIIRFGCRPEETSSRLYGYLNIITYILYVSLNDRNVNGSRVLY